MRKCVLMLVCFLFVSVIVSEASDTSCDNLVKVAEAYESNILGLVCGKPWEYPSSLSEFEPDTALGKYVKLSSNNHLVDKYNKFLSLESEVGKLDSGLSIEDLDGFRLSTEELLSLSNVCFSYFENPKEGYIIQLLEVRWVDGRNTIGYVSWDESGVNSIYVY